MWEDSQEEVKTVGEPTLDEDRKVSTQGPSWAVRETAMEGALGFSG